MLKKLRLGLTYADTVVEEDIVGDALETNASSSPPEGRHEENEPRSVGALE